MSSAIGYVETIREDLLDAAWRSTMSSPMRARRRVPSRRWTIAAATALTLFAAGVVGWLALRPGGLSSIRAQNDRRTSFLPTEPGIHRPVAAPSPAPAGSDAWKGVALGEAPAPAAGAAGNQTAASDQSAFNPGSVEPDLGAIHPVGDLSKVIKTASLSIVVGHDAFGDRFGGIGDIADRLGGYVSSSNTSGGESGFVTIRIPAGRFQEALRSLRRLGRVDSEEVRGKDVTAEYVDLAARLRIAKARRRVLMGLMDKAVSIEQTIRVQNALDDVQLRIEELQGEINVLNDRVSEATIRVSMRETGVKLHAEHNVENPSIGSAFDHAIAGFFSVVAGVIVGLGWVLPTIAVLAVLWFVVTRVRKRLA
jgi:uncharacterized protein DUF4349